MSTPIIEYIAENIKTAINAITTANGFNQDLVAVRPKRTDFLNTSWDDLTVLINQSSVETIAGAIMAQTFRQNFLLMAIVIDSDSATDPIDTRLNQVRSDIEKKLMADRTRGGYAFNMNLDGAAPFYDEDTALSGIIINISVDYRTVQDDPYTNI